MPVPSQTWQEWRPTFIERLTQDPTANRAWTEIERASGAGANLDQAVARILFTTIKWADYVSWDIKNSFAVQTQALKAAQRAAAVAKERSDDLRAEMFARRCIEALECAARTPWPFKNPRVATLQDAAVVYPEIGCKTFNDVVSSKEAEILRRWGPRKIMLAVLRSGLRAHGVHLSPRALSALAFCADPDWNVDERNLRRFFSEPMVERAEQGYMAIFESLLREAEIQLVPENAPS